MSPFVCLFKPVVYGLYAGAQLTEYGGDLFLFVGRNELFAFAAGEVEAAARKAALYLPSHLAYYFAGHFVIQLRHSAGVPAGGGTAEECAAAFAFQCGYVARVYGAYHDFRSPGRFHGEFRHQCVQALSALRALFVRGKAIGIVMRLGFQAWFHVVFVIFKFIVFHSISLIPSASPIRSALFPTVCVLT